MWANHHSSERGLTALHFAAFYGNIDMVEYIVDELGADIEAMDVND